MMESGLLDLMYGQVEWIQGFYTRCINPVIEDLTGKDNHDDELMGVEMGEDLGDNFIDKAQAKAIAYVMPMMQERLKDLMKAPLAEGIIVWDAIKSVCHAYQCYNYYKENDYQNAGHEMGNIVRDIIHMAKGEVTVNVDGYDITFAQ